MASKAGQSGGAFGMNSAPSATQIQAWKIGRLVFYVRNPRKNDAAVDRMCASIREYGFKIPVLARSSGEVVDGHLRLKAARKLGITEAPVILCDEWSEAQVKAFRLMVNRSVGWAEWDDELLAQELADLKGLDFDLSLTGFDDREIDDFLSDPGDDERADQVPPIPEQPATRLGDLWALGEHRLICADSTQADVVAKLLGTVKPLLMVTDPPYGIELDTEWRDRAGLNGAPVHGRPRNEGDKRRARNSALYKATPAYMRTEGHREVSISGDTVADWSPAFELVPSLQVAYVWHASVHTVEVVNGLLRIGFLYPQQIIWNKGRPVLTRTHYWFAHEPCWYVRKKNAPWFGTQGSENTTIWEARSPKFIMGGSKAVGDDKQDHPTQKPVELIRKPILNHLRRGELVYDPFLGSGTTLIAAEMTERKCYGVELDPKYVDVICQRFMTFSGKPATLDGDGRTFEEVKAERLRVAA
jgi:DNA modification methylase